MRVIAAVFLQIITFAAAVGERRKDLGLDTTPIFEGAPMYKFTEAESDQLGNICGQHSQRNSLLKIHNGYAAKPGQFPSTVYIMIFFDEFKTRKNCTGTLISDRHILTAGHCVEQMGKFASPGEIYVHMGGVCVTKKGNCEDNEYYKNNKFTQGLFAKSYLRFKEYTDAPRADLVVLELQSHATVDSRVSPACLPEPQDLYSSKQDLYANGFGKDESDTYVNDLRYYKTTFADPSYDRSNKKLDYLYITDHNCGPSSTRKYGEGDSGSGLLSLAGERLSVLGSLSRANCYTDIRYYIKAICKNIGICYSTLKGRH